jgi:hypothetical protein
MANIMIIIIKVPLPVSSAKVVATPYVPLAKASNSKTPIGPLYMYMYIYVNICIFIYIYIYIHSFIYIYMYIYIRISIYTYMHTNKCTTYKCLYIPFQMTVLQSARPAWMSARVLGPMSRPIHPSSMLSMDTT